MIGMDSERESRDTVQLTQHDDEDNNDDEMYKLFYILPYELISRLERTLV